MFFYVVSRTYAEIFSLLRICSGLISDSPGLMVCCLLWTSIPMAIYSLTVALNRPPLSVAGLTVNSAI